MNTQTRRMPVGSIAALIGVVMLLFDYISTGYASASPLTAAFLVATVIALGVATLRSVGFVNALVAILGVAVLYRHLGFSGLLSALVVLACLIWLIRPLRR